MAKIEKRLYGKKNYTNKKLTRIKHAELFPCTNNTTAAEKSHGGCVNLVDFSDVILPALYFACSNNFEDDGFIYALDRKRFNIDSKIRKNIKKNYFLEPLTNLRDLDTKKRVKNQSGIFVRTSRGFIETDIEKIKCVSIPANEKRVISYVGDKFLEMNSNRYYAPGMTQNKNSEKLSEFIEEASYRKMITAIDDLKNDAEKYSTKDVPPRIMAMHEALARGFFSNPENLDQLNKKSGGRE